MAQRAHVRPTDGWLQRRRDELASLPLAARAGIVVIGIGLAVDAYVHLTGVVVAGSALAFVVRQHLAHLLVLVGMVGTLAGIVVGAHRHRPTTPRRDLDALR